MIFNLKRERKIVRIARFIGLALAASVFMVLSAPAVGADKPGEKAASGKIPFPRPQSHRANWIEYHGKTVDLNFSEAGQAGTACLACHGKNDCIACHNTLPPRDHTNFWRTRGHGFAAEGNRERCLTCHKQDYCVRCHNETAPRTHTADWRTRHCTWCHFGSGIAPADNCSVCHRQAPHTSAPHPVNGAMNCSLCHP